MLTRIIHQSPQLVTFFESLGLPLTKPQKRHLINLTDGILVTEGKKTLANIQRRFVEAPDPSNMADFLRISPWSTEEVRRRLQRFMVKRALEIAEAKGDPRIILLAVDDSIAEKDKQTSRLEAVDWHYDHLEGRKGKPRYKKGMAFIVVHVLIGSVHLVFDIPIYLREKTVRRLNRGRPKEKRLRFRGKYRLVRQVLEEVRELRGKLYRVPQKVRVWVSRKHHRDKRPVYLMGTDLALEVKKAFRWYGARWWDEIDNYYLQPLPV